MVSFRLLIPCRHQCVWFGQCRHWRKERDFSESAGANVLVRILKFATDFD